MPAKIINESNHITTSKLLESVEARLYEDLFDAISPEVASREGLSLHRHGGALYLTASGHDHPMFNRVMGVGLGKDPADTEAVKDVLDRAVEHYRKAGVRRWMVQLLPHMETDAFRLAAGEQGVIRLRGWAKHLGPAQADIPFQTDFRILRIDSDLTRTQREHLSDAWSRIVVKNFNLLPGFVPWLRELAGREKWHLSVAMDGDTPVATAAFYLSDVGEERIAELNFATTLPDYRGRGAQSALIARRVADAHALGAHWIVAETDEELPEKPNPSYRNMVRLGFPVVYVRANWGPPKPESD